MPEPPDDFFDDFERQDARSNVRPLPVDRVPPNDTAAEQAVISHVLGVESTERVRRICRPFDFYNDANRVIYQAAIEIEADGGKPDVLTIRGRLDDQSKLQRVGGVEYIVAILGEVPSVANVEAYAQRIADKAAMRAAIAAARRTVAEAYSAEDPAAFVAGVKILFDSIDVKRALPIEVASTSVVFEKQPPIPWLSRDLYLAPGRPCLVAGYGYSAKSVSCQALLIAIAAGVPIWGKFRVQRMGPVLHLDHEQGKRATFLRYQRLTRAMGLSPEDLGDRLRVASLPKRFRLSNPDAEDVLERSVEGCVVCLIDSLRATTPGVDENDSQIREHLDKLLRVSERTGCAFIVIHHAGKNGKEKDARERGRGSSAIFDACGLVLQLDGKRQDDGATLVEISMTKAPAEASGAAIDPFYLYVNDVLDNESTDDRWGLSCEVRSKEQVDPPKTPNEVLDGVCEDVLAIIRGETDRNSLSRNGVKGVSGNFVRGMYRGKSTKLITPALERLEGKGLIVRQKRAGRGGGCSWSIAETIEEV